MSISVTDLDSLEVDAMSAIQDLMTGNKDSENVLKFIRPTGEKDADIQSVLDIYRASASPTNGRVTASVCDIHHHATTAH